MTLKTVLSVLLSLVILLSMPLTASFAGDAGSEYQDAKQQNRAHVGIHQRREAYREEVMNGESNSSISEIAPAAGDGTQQDSGQNQDDKSVNKETDREQKGAR